MHLNIPKVSPTCIVRLQTQGYLNYSDKELSDYRFGIRFAYAVCTTLVVSGLVLNNMTLLIIAAIIALGGTLPPYHPVDYLYNYVIRHLLGKPKLPPRTNQGRFACSLAAVFLMISIYFFYKEQFIPAYIFIGTLLTSAILVISTDICIPSMIYNALFKRKDKSANLNSA